MTVKKDTLYQNIQGQIKPFSFDEQVAEVFTDMINRSVPGYEQTLAMLRVIAAEYARDNSRVYDLGCSLGAASIVLAQSIDKPGCQIIAVDNSAAMIRRCQRSLQSLTLSCPIELQQADMREVAIENAAIVVMNFSLQFLPVAERSDLLQSIHAGLLPGGVLLLSEKIHTHDKQCQGLMTRLHESYKKMNGYDALEISAKRTALENVLLTETLQEHQQRLDNCGFQQVHVLMQNLNFITLLAEK